jgi:hypothetical protein
MSTRQRVQHAIIGIRTFAGTKFVAIAGLIGGAALGAGVAVAAWPPAQGPTTAAVQESPASAVTPARPCDQQTWPYLDASCLKAGAGPARQVRLLSTDQNVPRTLKTVTASGPTNVKAARTAPQPNAAIIAANVAAPTAATQSPAAQPTAQSPASVNNRTARRAVTVHFARKLAHGEVRYSRHSQSRVAGPMELTPGQGAATADRRWNDTSRSVMAFGDDGGAASRTFVVPRETPFGQQPFFQR